jgi:hypothetical protein
MTHQQNRYRVKKPESSLLKRTGAGETSPGQLAWRPPPMNPQNCAVPEPATTHVPPANAQNKPAVPQEIRVLLGPSWLVEGEDAQRYEDLLAAVASAVKPGT